MRTTRLVVVGLFAVVGLLPGAAFAQTQPAQSQACGVQLPFESGDQIQLQQPSDLGMNDQGVINYSGVRGSIVHMSGPLALVQLDTAGAGNATSNQVLAGNGMAVVQLPSDCNLSDFSPGTPIMAIGTPTDAGILNAVAVTSS